jgi:hypothetical protein
MTETVDDEIRRALWICRVCGRMTMVADRIRSNEVRVSYDDGAGNVMRTHPECLRFGATRNLWRTLGARLVLWAGRHVNKAARP